MKNIHRVSAFAAAVCLLSAAVAQAQVVLPHFDPPPPAPRLPPNVNLVPPLPPLPPPPPPAQPCGPAGCIRAIPAPCTTQNNNSNCVAQPAQAAQPAPARAQ